MRRNFIALDMILLVMALFTPAGIDPRTLPAVSYQPGGIAYWAVPYFANAMAAGLWLEYEEYQWGDEVNLWNNPQFDANGYPRYLNPGRKLRCILFGLHSGYGNRPAGWPVRNRLASGRVVLTWQGEADIRLDGGTFLPAPSSGPENGRLLNGRRVYLFNEPDTAGWFNVEEIEAARPVTGIKVWLADPADPELSSLDGQLFHPAFLQRIAEAPWGLIRFMDFLQTNNNPQQDWADRRRPAHCFATGVLNPRNPAPGVAWMDGNQSTGVAYEHLVALCNATGKDLWLCVPHLATDEYVRKLARLLRYGSDGMEPYNSPQAHPVYPPLESGRRVFIEYSNEIWSGGGSFVQGEWAQVQADAAGITKPQFLARRFCQIWRLFEQVFGGAGRLVKVAAVFTAAEWYTRPFLEEMTVYGPTLTPPQEPDVIACTTYFGNGIQDWIYARARAQANSAAPWFLTPATFDAGGGVIRPVSVPPEDPYWTSAAFEAQQNQAFDEWTRRLLAGDAREGGGPDAVGVGGGFDEWLRQLALTMFPAPKPLIAYEGGPSLYTDYLDGGDSRDDGLTIFMEAINRHPRMAEVYAIHLNMALDKGLWTHAAFVDAGSWGKYGQWGHLEYLDQPNAEAPKWTFLLDWINEVAGLRHIDDRQGERPHFATPAILPVAVRGRPYSQEIAVAGGDGQLRLKITGRHLPAGLTATLPPDNPPRVSLTGLPVEPGNYYLYLRVADADGDPAWRTYTLKVAGGPGVLLESDFTGASPALHTPWTKYYAKAEGLNSSGWLGGAGILPEEGDNALVWSVNAPGDLAAATLANAIADEEYLALTIEPPAGKALDLRGAEVRFTIRRIDYHAPRRYAVFSSVAGFTAGQELFVSDFCETSDDLDVTGYFPLTAAYQNLTGPVTLRIYGFQAQWGGHATSLADFRWSVPVRLGDVDGNGRLDAADALRLAEYLAGDGPAADPTVADLDGDGRISAADLLRLRLLLF